MRFERLIPIGVLAGLIVLGGCLASDEQEYKAREAQLTRLIDQRQYSQAITEIEADPWERLEFTDLLALAYLGRSGFEPLRLARRVVGPQSWDTPGSNAASGGRVASRGRPGLLNRLIPGCSPAELGRKDTLPLRCLLKRLWMQLPDADQPDFARARDLLRAHYTDPRQAPARFNTLLTLLEGSSALSRLVRLLSEALDPGALNLAELERQLALLAGNATQTLDRARYSVPGVSQQLTGLEREPLFVFAEQQLRWLDQTGIPALSQAAQDHDWEEARRALGLLLAQLQRPEGQTASAAW